MFFMNGVMPALSFKFKLLQMCIVASVTVYLSFIHCPVSLSLSPQPEEYGQEAMEGQGEAMLEPEGETYDETQQVISLHNTKCIHVFILKYRMSVFLN